MALSLTSVVDRVALIYVKEQGRFIDKDHLLTLLKNSSTDPQELSRLSDEHLCKFITTVFKDSDCSLSVT
jgi:hypothetical protein